MRFYAKRRLELKLGIFGFSPSWKLQKYFYFAFRPVPNTAKLVKILLIARKYFFRQKQN